MHTRPNLMKQAALAKMNGTLLHAPTLSLFLR